MVAPKKTTARKTAPRKSVPRKASPKKVVDPSVVDPTVDTVPTEPPPGEPLPPNEPTPPVPTPAPTPPSEPTAEQRRIAELEARLEALLNRGPSQVDVGLPTVSQSADELLIHVLEDGCPRIIKNVLYRGQEVRATKGTDEYDALKRFIDRTPTKADQYRRWGKQFWDYGPWPGGDWLDRDDLDYGGPTKSEYEEVPARKGFGPRVQAE